MYNWTEREKKLVSIAFELGITIHTHPYFKDKKIPDVAAWISDQLNQCGFRNHPVGSSWGSLVEEETYEKMRGESYASLSNKRDSPESGEDLEEI